ncbi:hypothetical protein TWF696_006640 [Orbilia brochopaga]|uniref:Extracellular membrane protein CFEM domain-containing protein n=1 Tax=Orbilia brochopaga TaxID=3140254 RepID=A0AAV9URZ1_9PEZI
MSFSVKTRLLPALLLAFLPRTIAQDSVVTVSIFDEPSLQSIRPCASTCMTRVYSYIQCPNSPLPNSCFCRTDLTEIARKSLFACVTNFCNGGYLADGSTMTAIYTNYCQSVNGNQPADNVAETTPIPTDSSSADPVVETSVVTSVQVVTTEVESVVTLATGTITTQVQSSVTQVVYSTITTVLDDMTLQQLAKQYESSHSGGLQRGDKIAIVVGVIALIIITLLLFQNPIRRKLFGYQGPYGNAGGMPTGGISDMSPHGMGQAEMGHPLPPQPPQPPQPPLAPYLYGSK